MVVGLSNGSNPFTEEHKFGLAILWCRRDLRVTDNPALTAALQLAKEVVGPLAKKRCARLSQICQLLSNLRGAHPKACLHLLSHRQG